MVQIVATTEARPDRTVRRKRELLKAASAVFRRKGLHASGMRDIAAENGMHVGNLYYYFESKQELLAFCQQDTLDRLHRLAAHVSGLPLGADRRLYLLIVGHALCLHEGTPGSLAHLELEALEEPLRTPILARRDQYERAVRSLVQEGIDEGLFRETDVGSAAMAILGALNWTVKWFRPEGPKPARDIGRQFAEMLLRGLLAPGARLVSPDLALLSEAELVGDPGEDRE